MDYKLDWNDHSNIVRNKIAKNINSIRYITKNKEQVTVLTDR